MLMVKPGMTYLDIARQIKDKVCLLGFTKATICGSLHHNKQKESDMIHSHQARFIYYSQAVAAKSY